MDRGKVLNWLIIFSVLSCFTIYAIVNTAGNATQKALAKLIARDPDMEHMTHALIFEDIDDDSDTEAIFGERFLHRLARFYGKEKICALTQEQYDQISSLQNTSIDIIHVGGKDINVAKIEGDLEFSPNDIRRILIEEGGTLSCRILRHNNFLYLLFSPHIS